MDMLSAHEDNAIPIFFFKQVQDHAASKEAGRPIFKDKPYVKILIPGDKNLIHTPPVNEQHQQRWPEQWRKFQEKGDVEIEGTPLEQWPVLTRAQVEELKALNILSVEALATLSDSYLKMGLGDLKRRAAAFLEACSGDSVAAEKVAELEKKLEGRDEELAEMRELVKELTAEVKALQSVQPKRGRPRKTPE